MGLLTLIRTHFAAGSGSVSVERSEIAPVGADVMCHAATGFAKCGKSIPASSGVIQGEYNDNLGKLEIFFYAIFALI